MATRHSCSSSCLIRKLDGEFECLYDLPLPFAEDVRSYQFPPTRFSQLRGLYSRSTDFSLATT